MTLCGTRVEVTVTTVTLRSLVSPSLWRERLCCARACAGLVQSLASPYCARACKGPRPLGNTDRIMVVRAAWQLLAGVLLPAVALAANQ